MGRCEDLPDVAKMRRDMPYEMKRRDGWDSRGGTEDEEGPTASELERARLELSICVMARLVEADRTLHPT